MHLRTIVEQYQFQDPESVDGGSSEEPYLQPARNNSGDGVQGESGCAEWKELEDEVPWPFEYFEDEAALDNEEGNGEAPHKSDPLPQIYSFETPPQDLTKLEPLEYYPLDPEIYPVRLLVILPHFGNPYSTVQCNLFPVSFQNHHYCYAAIHQTRGNKTLTSNIIVNCKTKQVTRNLEVFLRHFRREECTQLVWIREICIYPGDNPIHKTPDWRDWIMNNACRILSMPDFMEQLQEDGTLEKEKQITIREKHWSKVIRSDFPTHYPIPLRSFTYDELKSDETATRIAHEYVPLDLVAEEIRLVVLLPAANRADPLYAHFAHESIYGEVAYQCLSYTWGTGEATSELTLSGQLFPIRKNLEDALRSLRSEVSKTTLWIDAICIDQENVRERSRQVARMHQIYEKADVVLVWLGEADEYSDVAMDFIASARGYSSMENPMGYVAGDDGEAEVPRPFEYFDDTWESENSEILQASSPSQESRDQSPVERGKGKGVLEEGVQGLKLGDVKGSARLACCWAAIYQLLQRPYFRRMWVVQEVAAASIPTVWCGKRRAAWEDVHAASLELMMHWDSARNMCEEFGIEFDSNQKGKEVRCIAPPEGGLPSWVPDWRTKSHVNGYLRPEVLPMTHVDELEDLDAPIYRAARSTKAVVSFFEDDEWLVCGGILTDTISLVASGSENPYDWYPTALKHCHYFGKGFPEEQVHRDFWSMIFGDETSSWEVDAEKGGHVVNEIQRGKVHKTAQIFSDPKVITPNIKGRCLVVTKNGFMGLAPLWVEEGDTLAILFGCNVPVLLGKCKEDSAHFHLKGDCFVQGWMKGEMLDILGEASDEEIVEGVVSKMPGIQIR